MGLRKAVAIVDDTAADVVAVAVADKAQSPRKNHRQYFVVVAVGKTNRQTRQTGRTGWIESIDSRSAAEVGASTFEGRTVPHPGAETEVAVGSAAAWSHCRLRMNTPSRTAVAAVVEKEEVEYPAWAHKGP